MVYDENGKETKKKVNQDKIYIIAENRPIFEGEKLKLAENPTEIGTRVLIEFVIDTT